MELILTPETISTAIAIFFLRIVNVALDTVRVLVVLRGQKIISWILGFLQTIIFILALAPVLTELNNILIVFGYASGFATGNILGMYFDERLAIGHLHLTIVSSTRGAAISQMLRENGFAVTEIPGRGKDGSVTVINCDVQRKNLGKVETIVLESDPNAFITSEDVRPIHRGFWR